MSATIVDMPKVTQMLDAGWKITIELNGMGSYTATAFHMNGRIRDKVADLLRKTHNAVPEQAMAYDREFDWDDEERLITDDFTPEQALTRLAYKVHGEII